MQLLNPPDVAYPLEAGRDYRPNWRHASPSFLSEEHQRIWETTKDLPGWQDPADSEKLYEMAYHSGAIILEIGTFGGRSATVELRGALRSRADRASAGPVPQFYGVDVDRGSVHRTRDTLVQQNLLDHCLLFHGDLARFHRDVPIVPTMVFVDGDHRYQGVWADLNILRQFLAPGTPVLCHDYAGIPGVKRAIDQWLTTGFYEPLGQFAGSAFLRTTNRCPGVVRGLNPNTFDAVRKSLFDRYFTGQGIAENTWFTPTRRQTAPAREELRPHQPQPSGNRWPYTNPVNALPPTLPNGHPWPKITVVTPSFNQGKYIEETILSILNQNYPNLEHIIMDGGSTDETSAVLDRYRDRVTKIVSEKDNGQSHAINKGMALATGDILTWVNSDDMLAPGALVAAAMAFNSSGADMIAGVCRLYRDGQYIGGHVTSCADNQPLPLADLLDLDHCWNTGQFFHQPEVLFTRDLWEKAGAKVDESLYYSMDYDLWVRFAKAGARLHVIGRSIAHFRVHEEQKTFAPSKFIKELQDVRNRHAAEAGNPPKPNPRVNAKGALRATVSAAAAPVGRALAVAGHPVTILGAKTPPPAQTDIDLSDIASRTCVAPAATDDAPPIPKSAARNLLGLPNDALIVCVVPHRLHQAVDAANRLNLPAPRPLPEESDRRARTLELSAADVFVCDTVVSSAEAAACGSPSIGMIPGSLVDGVTGRLAESDDVDGLVDALSVFRDDPALLRNLGRWARFHAENEWSPEAAVHRVHNALSASGLADSLPLSRKILFPPAPAHVTDLAPADTIEEDLRLISGFGPWQEADAQKNLPRCRWAIGPAGKVEVRTAQPGRRRLTIGCHNYQQGQTLQVVVAGHVVAEEKLPVTTREHTVDVPVDIGRGVNQIELRYAKWTSPAPKKPPRAILITRISCDPVTSS